MKKTYKFLLSACLLSTMNAFGMTGGDEGRAPYNPAQHNDDMYIDQSHSDSDIYSDSESSDKIWGPATKKYEWGRLWQLDGGDIMFKTGNDKKVVDADGNPIKPTLESPSKIRISEATKIQGENSICGGSGAGLISTNELSFNWRARTKVEFTMIPDGNALLSELYPRILDFYIGQRLLTLHGYEQTRVTALYASTSVMLNQFVSGIPGAYFGDNNRIYMIETFDRTEAFEDEKMIDSFEGAGDVDRDRRLTDVAQYFTQDHWNTMVFLNWLDWSGTLTTDVREVSEAMKQIPELTGFDANIDLAATNVQDYCSLLGLNDFISEVRRTSDWDTDEIVSLSEESLRSLGMNKNDTVTFNVSARGAYSRADKMVEHALLQRQLYLARQAGNVDTIGVLEEALHQCENNLEIAPWTRARVLDDGRIQFVTRLPGKIGKVKTFIWRSADAEYDAN